MRAEDKYARINFAVKEALPAAINSNKELTTLIKDYARGDADLPVVRLEMTLVMNNATVDKGSITEDQAKGGLDRYKDLCAMAKYIDRDNPDSEDEQRKKLSEQGPDWLVTYKLQGSEKTAWVPEFAHPNAFIPLKSPPEALPTPAHLAGLSSKPYILPPLTHIPRAPALEALPTLTPGADPSGRLPASPEILVFAPSASESQPTPSQPSPTSPEILVFAPSPAASESLPPPAALESFALPASAGTPPEALARDVESASEDVTSRPH